MQATAERDAYQAHTNQCHLCRWGKECRREAELFKAWGDKLGANLPVPQNYDSASYIKAAERFSMPPAPTAQVILDDYGNPVEIIYKGMNYKVVEADDRERQP